MRGVRETAYLLVALVCLFFAASLFAKSKVTFVSPCECEGNHGIARWAAKTDPTEPPTNTNEIHLITPGQMFGWKGPGGNIPRGKGRTAEENQWYALTGKLKTLRVEEDGDLHMVLVDTNAATPFEVVAEIPLGERWCALRQTVFSWTDAVFPLSTGRKPFRLVQQPTITLIGRAFYDTDHSLETKGNQRNYKSDLSVWEIHPVMMLKVGTTTVSAPSGFRPASSSAPSPSVETAGEEGARATVQPQTTPQQFVTITQPVTIQIPYGTTVLQAGMKFPVMSRDAHTVWVRYMEQSYPIPVSSTQGQ